METKSMEERRKTLLQHRIYSLIMRKGNETNLHDAENENCQSKPEKSHHDQTEPTQ